MPTRLPPFRMFFIVRYAPSTSVFELLSRFRPFFPPRFYLLPVEYAKRVWLFMEDLRVLISVKCLGIEVLSRAFSNRSILQDNIQPPSIKEIWQDADLKKHMNISCCETIFTRHECLLVRTDYRKIPDRAM
jgi:hypothetical protein